MATSKTEEHQPLDVEEVYSKTETFVEDNKELLSIIAGVIIAVVGGYFAITKLWLGPLEEEAQLEVWKAEQYFENDQYDLALEGDGNYLGLLDVIDAYGWTKTANLAHYYAGISYLNLGQYETAIDYLSDFSSSDEMLSPLSEGAIGDAYSELGQYGKAIEQYKKAAQERDNEFTTPLFLMKAALLEQDQGNLASAEQLWETIQKEYPTSSEGRAAEKYLARVRAMQG